jgi:hypothetical protein|tara:strand:- start:190 stop:501 length:312 start_codon:yes stop_codon:yes gene_type:complete
MSKEQRSKIIQRVNVLASEDVKGLHNAEQSYGDSWKKRGGIGAFMMLARKWDRIEKQSCDYTYDIFLALEEDKRPEGLIDDIRDLRRYLLLVEAEMALQNNDK